MANTDINKRKLRMAQIGGGPGAFIGAVHRKAAAMDGNIELVAGAFSSNPAKSKQTGEELFLDPSRVYGSWGEMIEAEAKMPADKRIDLVSVVTPNHLHFAASKAALEAGFHVVQDKPMTLNLQEARDLVEVVKKTGRVFALTHTYTGYPMVKLARDLVKAGKLGAIRKIVAEYVQGWLYRDFENSGDNKQAEWRTDPALSGAGCLGDIGTHAANLSETISGLKLVEVAADVTTFVPGRRIDDDVSMLAHWEKGAKGVIHASQISVGEENEIAIYIYGDEASLEWRNAEQEQLLIRYPDRPMEVLSKGWGYVAAASPSAARGTRAPTDHPEGLIEAFANIYMEAAAAIRAVESGKDIKTLAFDFPTVEDGLRGMQFVAAALKSSADGGKWTKLA